jgi:hypothetical protein
MDMKAMNLCLKSVMVLQYSHGIANLCYQNGISGEELSELQLASDNSLG